MSRLNDENRLDDAVHQVVNEPLDPAEIEAATARVWQRLSQGAAAHAVPAVLSATSSAPEAPTGSLKSCGDFQALIPAYLAGELAPARALLVEDHTRNCVPCRRALREAREGKPAARPAANTNTARNRRIWTSLAAVLLMGVSVASFFGLQELLISGDQMARVESVEGSLLLVSGEGVRPLGAGDQVDEGDLVRTAKGSAAMLRMADGSLIEMNQRAGLELDASRKGNTVHLEGGQVIVHAAKQRSRHLFVATGDATVSVTGTIFSVNHGTKGTRVSVVEGEVRVKQARRDSILHPGDQVTTHASVAAVPIVREIAWSQNRAEYEQLLTELTALGRDIDAQVQRPGLRTSTRLLDSVPDGTTVYIALPNLSQSLSETHRILDQRIDGNPVLRNWWGDVVGNSQKEDKVRELIQRLGDLGQHLGDEIAIALDPEATEDGSEDGVVLLAQVTHQAGFRAALQNEINRLDGDERNHLVLVDDPSNVPAGTGKGGGNGNGNGNGPERMLLWVGEGLFVATPSAQTLAQVAANYEATGGNPFTSTPFHQRIAQAYSDGTSWLFAADLKKLVAAGHVDESAETMAAAEKAGILDLESFLLDRREIGNQVDTRAAVTFSQNRRGIASWLAAPSAMGSLRFYSPDANLVSAFVVKSPVAIIDDLITLDPDLEDELAKVQAESGIDPRNDLAAALGGEVALGIDGPLAPKPSWKLVAEVYDTTLLQSTLERIVAKIDAELRREGHGTLQIVADPSGGRTYYSLVGTGNLREDGGKAPEVSFHYLYEEGYLLAAPSRALLDRAIQQRDSGVTLAGSSKLRDLLGPDGQVNVSALVYQNLADLLDSAEKLMPGDGRNRKEAAALRAVVGHGPRVVYAYGYEDRILFGSSSESPLGLNLETLAGFGGILGMMDEVNDGARNGARGAHDAVEAN
ncbi:MAG TPA: FecR domain-containing protein [Thermoanaerobaculia bacterium]|nr:FecR domain-containing protein [Thermoanaerobaculia bacterium]